MIELKCEGLDKLERAASRIALYLSPAALEVEVMLIASFAGQALLAASVRTCIEAIYDLPEMTYDRTMALLDAHRRVSTADGPVIFEQVIEIDPDAEAEGATHLGRELVIDYARYVHDGYTQWVWGHDTGQFVEGKFWFEVALAQSYPTIIGYVRQAFINCVSRAMIKVTL